MNTLKYLFSRSHSDTVTTTTTVVTTAEPTRRALSKTVIKMPPPTAWNPPRAKVQLKLAIQRLRLLGTKKAQLAKVSRREIAGFLEKGKIETARIKVEAVMGEDTMVELLEVLELYCELLLARFGLIETIKEVDPGVQEAVAGIVHAALRTELKELHVLREMLMAKYGREFAIICIDNEDDYVSKRVSSKLLIEQPPQELVNLYLHEIAKAYSVDWHPEGSDPLDGMVPAAPELPVDASTPGVTRPAPPATPLRHPATLTPFPSTPPVDPPALARTVVISTNLPPAASPIAPPPPPGTSDQDAFDALTKRFAELKKR